jgi:hypothetical protein
VANVTATDEGLIIAADVMMAFFAGPSCGTPKLGRGRCGNDHVVLSHAGSKVMLTRAEASALSDLIAAAYFA